MRLESRVCRRWKMTWGRWRSFSIFAAHVADWAAGSLPLWPLPFPFAKANKTIPYPPFFFYSLIISLWEIIKKLQKNFMLTKRTKKKKKKKTKKESAPWTTSFSLETIILSAFCFVPWFHGLTCTSTQNLKLDLTRFSLRPSIMFSISTSGPKFEIK